MNTVGNILKAKGNTVWAISKDACVFDALKIFSEKRISSVVVVEGEKILGIFTERDFANKVWLVGKNAESVKIDEVMTRDLITVNPDQSVKVCMSMMTEKRIHHLPVIEQEKLLRQSVSTWLAILIGVIILLLALIFALVQAL